MANAMDISQAVFVFQQLGERREALQQANDKLAADIREALEATDGVLHRSAAAKMLGVDRTTLYKVYLKDTQTA